MDGVGTFYKLTRADGRDFWTGLVDYAAAYRTGSVLRHPLYGYLPPSQAADNTYFSVATAPSATLGNYIFEPDTPNLVPPSRLFEVEAVGKVTPLERFGRHDWRALQAMRVTKEHPAERVLGPNHEAVTAFFAAVKAKSGADLKRLAPSPRVISAQEYLRFMKGLLPYPGMYCLTLYLTLPCRFWALAATGNDTTPAYFAVRDALVTAAWGIATEGVLPRQVTERLTRSWRGVFGPVRARKENRGRELRP